MSRRREAADLARALLLSTQEQANLASAIEHQRQRQHQHHRFSPTPRHRQDGHSSPSDHHSDAEREVDIGDTSISHSAHSTSTADSRDLEIRPVNKEGLRMNVMQDGTGWNLVGRGGDVYGLSPGIPAMGMNGTVDPAAIMPPPERIAPLNSHSSSRPGSGTTSALPSGSSGRPDSANGAGDRGVSIGGGGASANANASASASATGSGPKSSIEPTYSSKPSKRDTGEGRVSLNMTSNESPIHTFTTPSNTRPIPPLVPSSINTHRYPNTNTNASTDANPASHFYLSITQTRAATPYLPVAQNQQPPEKPHAGSSLPYSPLPASTKASAHSSTHTPDSSKSKRSSENETPSGPLFSPTQLSRTNFATPGNSGRSSTIAMATGGISPLQINRNALLPRLVPSSRSAGGSDSAGGGNVNMDGDAARKVKTYSRSGMVNGVASSSAAIPAVIPGNATRDNSGTTAIDIVSSAAAPIELPSSSPPIIARKGSRGVGEGSITGSVPVPVSATSRDKRRNDSLSSDSEAAEGEEEEEEEEEEEPVEKRKTPSALGGKDGLVDSGRLHDRNRVGKSNSKIQVVLPSRPSSAGGHRDTDGGTAAGGGATAEKAKSRAVTPEREREKKKKRKPKETSPDPLAMTPLRSKKTKTSKEKSVEGARGQGVSTLGTGKVIAPSESINAPSASASTTASTRAPSASVSTSASAHVPVRVSRRQADNKAREAAETEARRAKRRAEKEAKARAAEAAAAAAAMESGTAGGGAAANGPRSSTRGKAVTPAPALATTRAAGPVAERVGASSSSVGVGVETPLAVRDDVKEVEKEMETRVAGGQEKGERASAVIDADDSPVPSKVTIKSQETSNVSVSGAVQSTSARSSRARQSLGASSGKGNVVGKTSKRRRVESDDDDGDNDEAEGKEKEEEEEEGVEEGKEDKTGKKIEGDSEGQGVGTRGNDVAGTRGDGKSGRNRRISTTPLTEVDDVDDDEGEEPGGGGRSGKRGEGGVNGNGNGKGEGKTAKLPQKGKGKGKGKAKTPGKRVVVDGEHDADEVEKENENEKDEGDAEKKEEEGQVKHAKPAITPSSKKSNTSGAEENKVKDRSRSPLQSIAVQQNVLATPVANGARSGAAVVGCGSTPLASASGSGSGSGSAVKKESTPGPGGHKWRTERNDLASVLAKFPGSKFTGMSRRTRIVPLHANIGPPKKALPPAPKKAEKRKKGEKSSEESEEEGDEEGDDEEGEGGGAGGGGGTEGGGKRKKKGKEKGIEWFMVED